MWAYYSNNNKGGKQELNTYLDQKFVIIPAQYNIGETHLSIHKNEDDQKVHKKEAVRMELTNIGVEECITSRAILSQGLNGLNVRGASEIDAVKISNTPIY